MSKLLEILSVARLQSHLDWPCQTVQPVHNTHSCACVCVWTKSKPNTVKLAQRKNGDTLAMASFPFPLSASHTDKCHLTPLLLMYMFVCVCCQLKRRVSASNPRMRPLNHVYAGQQFTLCSPLYPSLAAAEGEQEQQQQQPRLRESKRANRSECRHKGEAKGAAAVCVAVCHCTYARVCVCVCTQGAKIHPMLPEQQQNVTQSLSLPTLIQPLSQSNDSSARTSTTTVLLSLCACVCMQGAKIHPKLPEPHIRKQKQFIKSFSLSLPTLSHSDCCSRPLCHTHRENDSSAHASSLCLRRRRLRLSLSRDVCAVATTCSLSQRWAQFEFSARRVRLVPPLLSQTAFV